MSSDLKSSNDRAVLSLFYHTALHFKWTALLCLFVPISVLLTSVFAPYLSSRILASLINGRDQVQRDLILLVVVYIIGVLINRVGMVNLMKIQAKSMAHLHQIVFERLLQRGTRFYANQVSGKLISDVIDVTSSFSMLANAIFLTGLGFLVTVIAGLIVVFINSWQLGLFLLCFIVIIITWTATESIRRSQLRYQRLIASKKLTSHLSDSITNMQTVKTFSSEQNEEKTSKKLSRVLQALREHDWQWTVRSGNNRMGIVFAAQVVLVTLLVQLSKNDPAILATGIFAFTYTITIANKLFDLNALTRQVEESLLQAQPITEMLAEKIEVTDHPNAQKLIVSEGSIEFNNVSFDYEEGDKDNAVFKDLSLHIKPGEKIGLVGSSGGGKSTLTRLLLRFEDIQAGEITIDNQNIAEVYQTSLRQHIAYVPQEPLLFHRSIIDNIRYGKPKATQEQVEAVARKAHAHTFIKDLPQGYDTLVGERGVKLSGGQKQRIAIARAMIKDAPILMLDEATSALDSESEVLIQDALWKLMEGRTVIAIAHRLSTIQKMDRIIVLDDGKIIEEGSHKDLVALKGKYAQLWKHQSGGFLEA